MSKQDFKVLAEALKDARGDLTNQELPVLDLVVGRIASALVWHCPRFDQNKFRDAAGYREANW